MTWSARIVEQDGTVLVEALDGLTVDEVRWSLNRPATASITVATLAEGLELLESDDGEVVAEIQLWRGEDLVLWGVPVTIDYRPDVTAIGLADPLWLLDRRVIGDLDEENLLSNPSFEAGTYEDSGLDIPTDWSNDALEDIDVGFSVNAIDGTDICALITDSGGINRSLYQDVTLPASVEPGVLMFTCYAWVDPLTAFDNTSPDALADYELGLVARIYDDNVEQVLLAWYPLTTSVDRFGWTRMSVPIEVPEHDFNWTARFELHPALNSGKWYIDACRMVWVGRLSFLGIDQATIAETLVEHAQDPAVNKADLGILTDCPATGVPRNRLYPWAEPTTVLQALTDLADMDDGFDFDVVCTSTTKTFTTYHPLGGTVTAAFTWGENIVDWSIGSGLANAAGSVAVFGEGTTDATGRSDDRERAWVSDPDAHSGRMLEVVEVGQVRANTSELRDQAQGVLDARRVPRVLSLSVREAGVDWVQEVVDRTLYVGDLCDVVIDHGPVQVDATYRVVEISVDPRTETVKPILELVPVSSS